MKKYNSLGELFIAYRKFNDLSQIDFASQVDVDVRTVQRWEKNVTLIKSEKEEDIVLETLLPYQLIRNLNASVVIPTYYDFRLRKYSLTQLSQKLPKANWFKAQINFETNRLRKIDFDFDIKYLTQFIDSQRGNDQFLNKNLIKEAVRILPELNYVLTDDAGYYVGHCIVLPIKESTYKKLRNRELDNSQLTTHDLTGFRSLDRPIFLNYDITADCNDNFYYILGELLRFFRDFKKNDYLICVYTLRDDTYNQAKDAGMKVVWQDSDLQKQLGLSIPPRFSEGNYKNFLSDST